MFKVQSIHSEFYALWVNKKGLFIEKITLNSIQDWWRLDISQHQTVQSVSGIWLVSVDSFCCSCRRCLVSWVGPFFLPIGVVGVFTQSVAIVVVICSTAGQEGHGESREENMRRNNYTFYLWKESLRDIAHALRKVSIHVAMTTEVLLVYGLETVFNFIQDFFFITWLLIHIVNVDVGIFYLKL